MAKLKQAIINKIKTDPDLFAVVAKAMGVLPASLAANIDRNGKAVNQYNVVKAIADFLGESPEKILGKEASRV
jgi:hypothetical protein